MTADEFRACLVTLDWSQRSIARLLDRDERMVRALGGRSLQYPR
jgi:hypothetical protein